MNSHGTTTFLSLENALQWACTNHNLSHISLPRAEKSIRMKKMLSLLDNPHLNYKCIHITGTKGKTSTAYACSYFLKEAQQSVGLFTSPHIHTFNERILINHNPIDDSLFLSVLNKIYLLTQEHSLSLTMFEILTATAVEVFFQCKVEYAIFEVGIGGRYDTTNFLQPVACVITNIEKEHTHILGDTIEEIAYEKSGIIKPNTPVWIGTQQYSTALTTLTSYAEKHHAPYHYLPHCISIHHVNSSESTITTLPTSSLPIATSQWNAVSIYSPSLSPLLIENQIWADMLIHSLLENSSPTLPRVYEQSIQPYCRSELLTNHKNQSIFLNGGHTPLAFEDSFSVLNDMDTSIILILALFSDKDIEGIMRVIRTNKHLIDHIVLINISKTIGNKSLIAPTIFNSYLSPLFKICVMNNVSSAMEYAYRYIDNHINTLSLGVLGSFHVCADCRTWWLEHQTT